MQKEINKLVSKNKARVKPAPRGKAPSRKLLSSILLHLKIEQFTKRKKRKMEAAIRHHGVLKVVATRLILQGPGMSNCNLWTPLDKQLLFHSLISYPVFCMSPLFKFTMFYYFIIFYSLLVIRNVIYYIGYTLNANANISLCKVTFT